VFLFVCSLDMVIFSTTMKNISLLESMFMTLNSFSSYIHNDVTCFLYI